MFYNGQLVLARCSPTHSFMVMAEAVMAEAAMAEADVATLRESRVTVCKIVTHTYADAQGHLDVGFLLQWMDIAACLSAEKHCKKNCVTLSMDDLHFDAVVPLGMIVRLEGQINKIFGSSMEVGVTVVSERPSQSDSRPAECIVCSACFTFVALLDGKPYKNIPTAIAATLEERFAATLATERKRWRTKRLQLESEARSPGVSRNSSIVEEGPIHESGSSDTGRGGCFGTGAKPIEYVSSESGRGLADCTMTQLGEARMASNPDLPSGCSDGRPIRAPACDSPPKPCQSSRQYLWRAAHVMDGRGCECRCQ